ncbi:MAG: ABC transporter permease subunit [Candidatus Bilamarchaeum sp.]
MKSREFAIYILLIAILTVCVLGEQSLQIPHDIARTFIRMICAYLLSLVFSISLGIYIAHNRKAFSIIFPFLDVLQSVPILGFLPFAVVFLVNTIPILGSEVSSVFLIFTSMTWALVFNVIEGVRSIPNDLKDASRLMGMSNFRYLFHVILPAIYAPVISGSMTAWGGGWYFLVAGEYVTFGQQPPYILPGIGSFIARSAYSGDILHSVLGMMILAGMVLFMNLFVWQPLTARSARFSYSQSAQESTASLNENKITQFIDSIYNKVKRACIASTDKAIWIDKLGITPLTTIVDEKKEAKYEYLVPGIVLVLFVGSYILSGKDIAQVIEMFYFAIRTTLRIAVAYILALAIATFIAIYVGRHKKLSTFLMPIFDIAQSIPAIAVFPLIVVLVIQLIGGGLGIEVASLMLLLTGMFWYLLFNLIRSTQTIPSEIVEVSSIMKLSMWQKIWNVFIPAMMPTIIIASMQSIGGGWNASIISEYIPYKQQIFYAEGIGYLLDVSAIKGDTLGIIMCVMVMVSIIIFLNKFLWRKALKRAEVYKF